MTTNPSIPIPEAAIEAGGRAIWAPKRVSDYYAARRLALSALEAAAPHLLKEAHSAIEHLHNDVGTLTDQLNRARDALQRIVTTPSVASPEAIAREALIAWRPQVSEPLDVDERYEDSLRNRHTVDRVARGKVAHGPCDVCFLLARLDRVRRTVEEAELGERAEIRLREQHQRDLARARQDVWDVRNEWYGAVIERDQARQDVLMLREHVGCVFQDCELCQQALTATDHYEHEQYRQESGAQEGEA